MMISTATARRVLFGAAVLGISFLTQDHGRGQGTCGPTVNAIVCENGNPGTPSSVWDVSGAGDSTIQGFATQISVTPGQVQQFKVDTSAAGFNLDIYRLGYYGGMGAR